MSATALASVPYDELAPGKVQLAPCLFDEIVSLVLEGYGATSHGGLEIGGVLFGRREGGSIIVEAFRPLRCDHSLGPRFLLSEADEEKLRELIAAPDAQPALRGLEAVGWYCSHTRSDLLLLDRETLLHDLYFPAPDGFVVILKPRDLNSVDARIFFRGSDGVLDMKGASIASDSLDAPPQIERGSDSTVSTREPELPPPASPRPTSFTHRRFAVQSKWKRLLLGVAAGAVVCFGTWQLADSTRANGAPSRLSYADVALTLRPQAENLMLSWKSNLSKPKRARVDIFDGGTSKHLDITDIYQPSGVLLFPHNTGNVQAVLTVELEDKAVVRRTGFTDESVATQAAEIPDTTFEAAAPKVTKLPQRHLRHRRHRR